MVVKKHPFSLRIIFFEYLIAIATALVLSFLVPFFIQFALVNTGFYTYANSGEIAAKEAKSVIAGANKFDSSLVPASCDYAFLSNSFTIVKSNMDPSNLANAVRYAQGKYTSGSLDDCYVSIIRKDGICVLHYYVRSQYKNKNLNKILPSPEKLMEGLLILNGIFSIFVCSTLFARRLKKQLQPVLDATQKIKERDLDFEVSNSGITEFNSILLSISDMKMELRHSLEQQWRMEQTRKNQMSALAHDIKTPLTVIRGNAELLRDSSITNEQQEYTGYIIKNADQMNQYLKMLIELTRADSGYTINLQKIKTKEFMKELINQANGLALAKQRKIKFSQSNLPEEFSVDTVLLNRAIMNIISNAADYSPENETVDISVNGLAGVMEFCIEDSGKGFSQEDLKYAATQFYMGDKSRGFGSHFGIGLYIADTIVKLHKGSLKISNSITTGGGKVTIDIPIEAK